MNGVGGWNASVWWALMADGARRQGYSLNITVSSLCHFSYLRITDMVPQPQFDHNRAFTPEGSILHKTFTSADAAEQTRLLTTPMAKLDELDMRVAASNLNLSGDGDVEMVEDKPTPANTVAPKYATRTIDEDYSEFDIE